MKRKALLIGNTNGLQGVKLDIERTATFLMSATGGTWYQQEIEYLQNPKKTVLLAKVEQLKSLYLDYAFVFFSGHGGYQRKTILELNADGETVQESQIQNIASRQLNIYDCCRVVDQQVKKSIALDSLSASFRESVDVSRQRYEARIMQAIPQQVQLYACAVGQYSYDTPNGAVYTNNLLSSANKVESEFKTVGAAHEEARVATIREKSDQTPEAVLPKCLTLQQLVISMRV